MSARLMRCRYCSLLQDEPVGVKICGGCGGQLEYEETTEEEDGAKALGEWLMDAYEFSENISCSDVSCITW